LKKIAERQKRLRELAHVAEPEALDREVLRHPPPGTTLAWADRQDAVSVAVTQHEVEQVAASDEGCHEAEEEVWVDGLHAPTSPPNLESRSNQYVKYSTETEPRNTHFVV
jgi:hypothetical protein